MSRKPPPSVQTLRERQALSVRALAAQAGLSVPTIIRLTHGLPTHPSSKQRVAAALQLRPDQIAWGDLSH